MQRRAVIARIKLLHDDKLAIHCGLTNFTAGCSPRWQCARDCRRLRVILVGADDVNTRRCGRTVVDRVRSQNARIPFGQVENAANDVRNC